MIVGLGFSPAFLGFLVRCVLSISLPLIAKSKYLLFASIHSSSVLSCFFQEFYVVASSYALNIAHVFPQLPKGHLLIHCVKSVQIRRFFFWPIFSRIWTEYGEIRSDISPYSVRIRENTDQKKLRIWTLFTQ